MAFSELVNEVRTELVQRYLANPRHSMAAISQMLGYSAPSAFTRWFSGQFWEAPRRWRGWGRGGGGESRGSRLQFVLLQGQGSVCRDCGRLGKGCRWRLATKAVTLRANALRCEG